MKLYYSPGACSLSPHIALLEAGIPFSVEKVDLKSKRTEHGGDYLKINSKGAVPALELDDGTVLTEGPAVTQYIADQKPDSGLAPRAGTFARYRLIEWLNYISAELHKAFGPLFNPKTAADAKAAAIATISVKFGWVAGQLGDRQYLMGDTFTVADSYLFAILNWTGKFGIDLGQWPALASYKNRIAQRPKVEEAMRAEGLIH